MNNKPLISIIMPCYNAEAYLADTIKNVFEQSYPNIELIIVDDGSTDKSPEILAQLGHQYSCLSIFYQKNQGPYPARNFALNHIKGDLIAFLDADDYWSLDCLDKLYNGLIKNNADLSYCGWQNIVENGINSSPYIPPAYENNNLFFHFLKGCPWPIHAALTRKSVINQINGFSTHCFSSMDYDFWLRISAVTQNITLVPEVLAFYRWHSHGQISSVKWKQILNARVVKKDFISKNPALVAHISKKELLFLVNNQISDQAYIAFWNRDLDSSLHLFRAMIRFNYWEMKDLKYLLLSLFPANLFKKIVLTLGK